MTNKGLVAVSTHWGYWKLQWSGSAGNIPQACQGLFTTKHEAEKQAELHNETVSNKVKNKKPTKVKCAPRKKKEAEE